MMWWGQLIAILVLCLGLIKPIKSDNSKWAKIPNPNETNMTALIKILVSENKWATHVHSGCKKALKLYLLFHSGKDTLPLKSLSVGKKMYPNWGSLFFFKPCWGSERGISLIRVHTWCYVNERSPRTSRPKARTSRRGIVKTEMSIFFRKECWCYRFDIV